MVGKPAHGAVRPGVWFVIGTTSNTGDAGCCTRPVDAACFSIYRPLQHTGIVGDVIRLSSSVTGHNRPGWTGIGAFLTG